MQGYSGGLDLQLGLDVPGSETVWHALARAPHDLFCLSLLTSRPNRYYIDYIYYTLTIDLHKINH